MKYTNTINTTTYDAGDGFYVDITATPTKLESWIYHKDYGDKSLMFGMMCSDINYDDYRECVENNLEEYINSYREEYMDSDDLEDYANNLDKWLDDYLEEYDDGDYDVMVDDTLYYILYKLGENGVPEIIASNIRLYAIELCRDALWPIELADRISKQAIAKYKENNYSDHWKEYI